MTIAPSIRERIGSKLKMDRERLAALAAFFKPGCPIAAGGPKSPAFPSAVRIVDAAIKPLGIKAERIGHAQHDHFAVLKRDQSVIQIAG